MVPSEEAVEVARIERLEKIVAMYSGALLRRVQNRIFNRQDAEEIVNDVFYKHFLHFDPEKGIDRIWLFKVTDNLCNDHLRMKQRNKKKAEFISMTENIQPTIPTDPYENHNASINKLKGFKASLSDEKQAIYKLYFGQKYRQEDIGEMLGIKRGTVAKHISDIKILAKEFLEK